MRCIMKKKFCNFLGVVLAVSLMIPGGALAAEVAPTHNTSQLATEQTQSSSEAKDQTDQAEQTEAVSEDEQNISSEQEVADNGVDQDTDGTRAGPLSEITTEVESEQQDFSSDLIAPVTLASVAGAPKVVDVNVANFEIQDLNHHTIYTAFHSDTVHLKLNWNASGNGTNLHEGDYFDIDLPENMKFPAGITKTDFDITDDEGNVVAKAHITPGPNQIGGKVHVTFGPGIENKYNVKGTINIAARFDETKIKPDKQNTFDITTNSGVPGKTQTKTTGIEIDGAKPIPEEYLVKWGQGTKDKNQAEWWSRINFSKATLTNAVVTDTLGSSGMTFIKDSFILRKVVYDKMGEETSVLEEYKANDLINSGKLKFSADMTSFTLNLGNTSDQYRLIYRSTYVPGTTLKNHMKIDSDIKKQEVIATHKSADTSGNASGDLASKIKLIKVDEDGTTPLKNAVFEVTAPDGSTFELTTGGDGTVTSNLLTQGSYKVKEKTAPKGYELSDKEYTLQVTPAGGAIQTITNKSIKTSVPVTKLWVGPKTNSVTVHLLADGTDTGKTVTLNEAGNWKGSFDGLRKYKADGTEIVYTVKEDNVANYTNAITGDVTSGFTITNTNIEKVDVPVKKEWAGPKAGPVTVHLLADGTDTGKTVTLSDTNSWTDTFSGLDKYKADGTEITYTVKEDEVSGYTSEVTGDATTGFTITNTEVPHDTSKPKEDTPKKSNRKPAKKSGGAVPYTGDSNATGIAIALASAAVVLIGGGVYLRRRDQRE